METRLKIILNFQLAVNVCCIALKQWTEPNFNGMIYISMPLSFSLKSSESKNEFQYLINSKIKVNFYKRLLCCYWLCYLISLETYRKANETLDCIHWICARCREMYSAYANAYYDIEQDIWNTWLNVVFSILWVECRPFVCFEIFKLVFMADILFFSLLKNNPRNSDETIEWTLSFIHRKLEFSIKKSRTKRHLITALRTVLAFSERVCWLWLAIFQLVIQTKD